jgi:Mn-dependent DtxR family transcriptional regulator
MMLERVLAIVAEGGLQSVAELARQLDVSEALIEMMLRDLARRGYLREVRSCHQACDHCSVNGCVSFVPDKIWTLTATGDRLAQKLSPLPPSVSVPPGPNPGDAE